MIATHPPVADRDRCIGSERCVDRAPATFTTDEEGLVQVLDGDFDPAAVRDAVANCPVGALSWAGAS